MHSGVFGTGAHALSPDSTVLKEMASVIQEGLMVLKNQG